MSGSTTLAPGSSAVIADNPAKFKVGWPQFTGTLFDSTFSLLNTGEPLAIKNSAGEIEDSISYSSAQGAVGDGYSLHKNGSSFVAALPSPGEFGGALRYRPSTPKPLAPATDAKSQGETPIPAGEPSALHGETSEAIEYAPQSALPLWSYVLGVMAGIVLGATGVLYARVTNKRVVEETRTVAEEFEIIE